MLSCGSPGLESKEPTQATSVVKLEGEDAGSIRSSPTVGGTVPAVDSFEVAQVLHVVGHVAIKHLVYLEIVERELKRQKEQQPKGEPLRLTLFQPLTLV
jgi:condensin complex subunit 1